MGGKKSSKQGKIEAEVERILKWCPATRDDIYLLIEEYYLQNFQIRTLAEMTQKRPTAYESVTRAARTIQNSLGLYPPSQEVKIARDEAEKEMFDHQVSR